VGQSVRNLVSTPLATARVAAAGGLPIPQGLQVLELAEHVDERGVFREIFRDDWAASPRPVQWNMVRSRPNVLRGFHAHIRHADYLTMASGEMVLGLHDLRPGSASFGLSAMLRLEADDPHLVAIPAGVGHGFYFPREAVHVYGVSEAFDGSDEFGCGWNDPALHLPWPCAAPMLSERDRTAGSYAALAETIRGQVVG
jgi:dTDP-4-dehydrorhamnose 3,5-epimerase